MYIKYKYSVKEVLIWTRQEIALFSVLAIVYTALYELAGWHWMEIPWTPLALVGTAVAFPERRSDFNHRSRHRN